MCWEELDYLFIDIPPGTGMCHDAVSIPADKRRSSRDLAAGLGQPYCEKAYNMTTNGYSVLGIIENMSYFKCPDCGGTHYIYGKSKIDEISSGLNIPVLGRIPIDPEIAELTDKGQIELVNIDYIKSAAEIIK